MSDARHLYWTEDAISIAKKHNKAIKIGSSPVERKDFNGFIESGIGDTLANARALIAECSPIRTRLLGISIKLCY